MGIHGKIQKKLKEEYEDQGYATSVEVSVSNTKSFYIVDLIAKNEKETIAVEIGNCTKSKLEFLKTKFDKVRHIPYVAKSKDGYMMHICGYIWKPRVDKPKSCPECKARLLL